MNDTHDKWDEQHGGEAPGADSATAAVDIEAVRRSLQDLLQQGLHDQALALCRRVNGVHADPDLLFLEARLLANGGRYADALRVCERVTDLVPEAPAVQALQVGLQVLTGDNVGALQTADRILARDPDDLNALINKSSALLHTKRTDECIVLSERVIELDPARAEGYLNKGAVLLEAGLAEWALETAEQGLRVAPDNRKLAVNRIGALLELNRPEEALAAIDALPFAENDYQLRFHRAEALRMLGRGEESREGLLELMFAADRPGWVGGEALRSLLGQLSVREVVERVRALGLPAARVANAVMETMKESCKTGRFAQLLEAMGAARVPGMDDWHLDVLQAIAQAALGRLDEVDAFFAGLSVEQAERMTSIYEDRWEILPADSPFRNSVDASLIRADHLMHRLMTCDWERQEAPLQELQGMIKTALAGEGQVPVRPYWTLMLPMETAERRRVAEREASLLVRYAQTHFPQVPVPQPPMSDGRLKIGYVSGDFRDHATGHLVRSMFAQHDRSRFEVYGYSLHPDDGSRYVEDIRAGMDHYVPLWDLSNEQGAQRIREDGIHILVDIHGYTKLARLELFAQRPAPIQVEYLAYPGTTGAPFFDYAIADWTVMPVGHEAEFSERLLRVPDCYQVNDRWQPISRLGITRRMVGLPDEGVVYCAFNRPEKLELSLFRRWMEILGQVEGSVLWCLQAGRTVTDNLRSTAEHLGVCGDRLIFAPKMPKSLHLERLGLADLYLDTLLYNGHTSASDALWAGVPVLTLPGQVFQSRVGASLLRAAGLADLVMEDLDHYVQVAVDLGQAPRRLAELKARLMDGRADCPLFDTRRFVRHLEIGLAMAWQRHRRGGMPVDIDVGAHVADGSAPGGGGSRSVFGR